MYIYDLMFMHTWKEIEYLVFPSLLFPSSLIPLGILEVGMMNKIKFLTKARKFIWLNFSLPMKEKKFVVLSNKE